MDFYWDFLLRTSSRYSIPFSAFIDMVEEEYQADTGTDDEGSLSKKKNQLFYRFLYLHIWSICSAMLNYKYLSCLSCYESLNVYRKKAKLYWSMDFRPLSTMNYTKGRKLWCHQCYKVYIGLDS